MKKLPYNYEPSGLNIKLIGLSQSHVTHVRKGYTIFNPENLQQVIAKDMSKQKGFAYRYEHLPSCLISMVEMRVPCPLRQRLFYPLADEFSGPIFRARRPDISTKNVALSCGKTLIRIKNCSIKQVAE